MTRPGLTIFSKEWYDEYLTECPEPLRPVVESICTGFQLGNTTDPNTVVRMIEDGLLQAFDYVYTLEDGAVRATMESLVMFWPGVWAFSTLSGKDYDFDQVEGREEREW